MKIKNKILLILLVVLVSSGALIITIWYGTSKKLTNTYLKNISESTMLDAYHTFNYLLTDTLYIATIISTNENNIIQPVKNLNTKTLMADRQWNLEYLDNKRIIMDFIKDTYGYKYYIGGITIAVNENCIFSANHLIEDEDSIYKQIEQLDQEKMISGIVMMEPVHAEGGKSILSSDYVVPAVKAIIDPYRNVLGYVILYFDYSVIETMFSSNLPDGSYFQVINENEGIIYSNCGDDVSIMEHLGNGYVYNLFEAENIGWKFSMAIPSKFYVEDINNSVVMTGIIIAIVFVLAGLACVFSISEITREIIVLRDIMREVSLGNLLVQYEVKSEDEIGEMGHTFNHMVGHIKDLMNKVTEEEREKHLNEIAFLQAQINPHFISNVLSNVVWMAKIQHADNIVPLINSLNSLLQNAMHQEKDLISISAELEYVENYITIMEYSGSYDFQIEKFIEEGTQNLCIPRFILQPIVENAIYYGLPEELSKRGRIIIKAWKKEKELYITVEDNGQGMTQEEIERIMSGKKKSKSTFNGIGLVNINKRIHLFFGDEYGLSYESVIGEYARAVFLLPVVEEETDVEN